VVDCGYMKFGGRSGPFIMMSVSISWLQLRPRRAVVRSQRRMIGLRQLLFDCNLGWICKRASPYSHTFGRSRAWQCLLNHYQAQ